MDHNAGPFYPNLPNSFNPAAAGKSHLKHLPRPCPADYPAAKIQNQSPEKTACRLPTTVRSWGRYVASLIMLRVLAFKVPFTSSYSI
jgi:hypothetical protein